MLAVGFSEPSVYLQTKIPLHETEQDTVGINLVTILGFICEKQEISITCSVALSDLIPNEIVYKLQFYSDCNIIVCSLGFPSVRCG